MVQTYKYDSLYRLKEAKETANTTQNWIQSYNYDRYGNRIGFNENIGGISNSQTPAIDPLTNRFTNTNFTYDKNGNIIHDISPTNQARDYVFNAENKQVEIKDANGNAIGKYYYDGEGKRVKKVTDQETTVFVYSGGKLVAEYSTKLSQTPTTSYTTTDHLGTPRVITDALGQIKARRDFMPFGEDITPNVGERSTNLKYGTTDDIRQKFTGYQKDTETELDFAEARMYENRYARFTAVDPLLASGKSANPQTFNRYAYVLNNPIVMIDGNGLYPVYFRTHTDGSTSYSTKKWNSKWNRYYGPKIEGVTTGKHGSGEKGTKLIITESSIRRVEYFTSNKSPVEKAANQLDNRQRANIATAGDQGTKKLYFGLAIIHGGGALLGCALSPCAPALVAAAIEAPATPITAGTIGGAALTTGILSTTGCGSSSGGCGGGLSPELSRQLGDIYSTYPINKGGCQCAAQEALQAFADNGITGNIVELRLGSAENYLENIVTADGKTLISDQGFHQAVQVGDRFYDAMTGSEGATWNEYQKLFMTNEFRPLTIMPEPRPYIPPQEDEP